MIFETVIFAAGIGSRLGDIGKKIPKALLPVWRNDGCLEPILIKLIGQSIKAGTSKVYIIVNHYSNDIQKLLDVYMQKLDIPVEIIFQEELDGEAGGLFCIDKLEHPILALDGDNYLSNDNFLQELIEEYKNNHNCLATIGVMEVPDINRYANVKIADDYRLVDIIEKPLKGMEFGNLAKMGCYLLSEKLVQKVKLFLRIQKVTLRQLLHFQIFAGILS